jgi:predicted RNase H-like nuclease (RuvC/YqgF family)
MANQQPPEDSAQVIISLESMIKQHIAALGKLNEEFRKHKEMLDDIFASDETYQKHLEAAKEATKVKMATKTQILKRPQAADLDKKVKELKAELKENQASLSDYLGEYQRLSGVNEIESDDGEVHEIVFSAKLIRRGAATR